MDCVHLIGSHSASCQVIRERFHSVYTCLQDILFRYPPRCTDHEGGGEDDLEDHDGGGGVEKELEERLLRLRGVFLTLSDSLATITGSLSHTKYASIQECVASSLNILAHCFTVLKHSSWYVHICTGSWNVGERCETPFTIGNIFLVVPS